MKKTKIIVPAIAALVLSAGASVSGTLAWFSADRTANSAVNNIAVINPEGSLSVGVTAIANTVADGNDIKLTESWKLRDASVQVDTSSTLSDSSATVWAATNPQSDGSASTFKTIASSYKYNETAKIAYAASWKLTFKIAGNSPDSYAIKFDATDAKSYLSGAGATDVIYNTYRIALWSTGASGVLAVWAPKIGSTTDLTYVSSSSKCTDTYDNCRGDTVTLGSIHATSSGESDTELNVYAFMWFEGTDPACLNSNLATGTSVSASANLCFKAE